MQMAASMTFLLQTLFVTMSVRCFLNGMPEYIDSPWPRFYSGIAIAIKLQEKLKRIIELIILKLYLFFFCSFEGTCMCDPNLCSCLHSV